ncbi:hypothetical protein [Salinicoccus sp. CNSTN-B1]
MIKTKVEHAIELEGQVLSKPEALWYFGNEGEIRNYFKGRKKEFTGNTAKTFKTTLEQYFETVDDTVKVGRGKGYKLGTARNQVAERNTKNATNGKYNHSTKHLDALMLAHLEHNLANGQEIQKSFINWLAEFKMINEAQLKLYKSRYNKTVRKDTNELLESTVGTADYRVLDHSYRFFIEDIRSLRKVMMNSLARMEKEEIIETFIRHKAYLNEPIKNTQGKDTHVISIDAKTYQQYVDAKRKIKDKYNLSENDINYRTFKPSEETLENVKKYKRDLRKFLAEEIVITDSYGTKINVSISNLWEELAIVVKASKKKTMDYLHKYHSEILVEYQIHKYERFLSLRASNYRSDRTEERLNKAEKSKKKYVSHEILKDEQYNNNKAFGKDVDSSTKSALKFKEDFMKAIEKLDKIFGDKFIIDEEKIKKALSK